MISRSPSTVRALLLKKTTERMAMELRLHPPHSCGRDQEKETLLCTMDAAPSEESLRKALLDRHAAVDAQADAVKALKAQPGASKAEIDAAVDALKALKVEAGAAAKRLQAAVASEGSAGREAFRLAVVNTLCATWRSSPRGRASSPSIPTTSGNGEGLQDWRRRGSQSAFRDKAKTRVADLQGMFSDLQSARRESRAGDAA